MALDPSIFTQNAVDELAAADDAAVLSQAATDAAAAQAIITAQGLTQDSAGNWFRSGKPANSPIPVK